MTRCFIGGAAAAGALGSFAAGSVTAVIALVTLSYGIVGSANAVLYLYTPEIYPTRMRAIGTGAATCWLRLASAAGPLLVGYLVAASGTAAVFIMFAAAGVVGAPCRHADAGNPQSAAGRHRSVVNFPGTSIGSRVLWLPEVLGCRFTRFTVQRFMGSFTGS